MEPVAQVDISQYTFDQFVSFLFDREVAVGPPRKWNPWFFQIEIEHNPHLTCKHYVRLFLQPAFLLDKFSKAQIEQGFWAIPGSNLECSVNNLLWDSKLSLAEKEQCIRSMFDLFRHFFAVEPVETSGHMWWDALCYDWECGNRKRERGGDDLDLQNIMFETLSSILALDSEFCQGAALHGLSHLHHPDTAKRVERHLNEHPMLSAKQKEYALAAAEFRLQ